MQMSLRLIDIKRCLIKGNKNFRIQKQNPALILARKHDNFVLPAPQGFGLDAQKLLFSHMYNCIYDCRYCFLQGMYSSANYVLFVNYEDFFKAISDTIDKNTDTSLTFFLVMIVIHWHSKKYGFLPKKL